ncbi:hypothetical protein C4S77_05715 [Apibacter adventoris]|uniref:Uncharacterized protein n=2 Tax=Apibacter adventoris TaxID=1679466 RepID=A0A2S8ADW4_9FLAO|nr:hypothetical protein C4S77_05715 [Apibacter adventoris]
MTESTIDSLVEKPKLLYFDDDNIEDKAQIQEKNSTKFLNFILKIYLSSQSKTIEIPVLNNSILYNNIKTDYYVSDPIIKGKIIELSVDYANQVTKKNISGEKKNLIEKIKFRYDIYNKKIQVIGYDLSYTKDNNGTYTKSFNLITGKYYSTYYLGDNKKRTSGWTSELQNIYAEDWNQDLLNKILLYGNEME